MARSKIGPTFCAVWFWPVTSAIGHGFWLFHHPRKGLIMFVELNSFPNDKFWLSQTKDFADDNFKFDEYSRKFSKQVENKQCLIFPQCFQNLHCKNVKTRSCLGKGQGSPADSFWKFYNIVMAGFIQLLMGRPEYFDNILERWENTGNYEWIPSLLPHFVCPLCRHCPCGQESIMCGMKHSLFNTLPSNKIINWSKWNAFANDSM